MQNYLAKSSQNPQEKLLNLDLQKPDSICQNCFSKIKSIKAYQKRWFKKTDSQYIFGLMQTGSKIQDFEIKENLVLNIDFANKTVTSQNITK